jgi:hypothetical protein
VPPEPHVVDVPNSRGSLPRDVQTIEDSRVQLRRNVDLVES